METYLVTGANGHFGNTLVRELVRRGMQVRASVRNPQDKAPFEGLDCEIIGADLLDKQQALAALDNVDVCIHAAAVFKHWSPNPEQDIVEANQAITQNILETAAEKGIHRLVYISSIAALDQDQDVLTDDSWNTRFVDYYYKSKSLSERLAWSLADDLNIDMVSVLPAGMVGPNTHGRLSDTMEGLRLVLDNGFPVDPNFGFHIVDVRDAAEATVNAVEHGVRGARYILGNKETTMASELFDIAREVAPGVKKPRRVSRRTLLFLAWISGIAARLDTHQTTAPQVAGSALLWQEVTAR